MSRPPLPPYTLETAAGNARLAEVAWSGRDAARVARARTADSRRRKPSASPQGRRAIDAFVPLEWQRELDSGR